jgi:cysteine desulfurase family protein
VTRADDCYLDDAATSRRKAPGVVAAMVHCLEEVGANPSRGAYGPGLEASRLIADARDGVARMLGVGDSARVVFTLNCTTALNIVIQGLAQAGSRVVITGVEHNAVLRPLTHLADQGRITVERCPADAAGRTNAHDLIARLDGRTALVVMPHASNVTGALQPVAEVAAATRAHGIPLLVDAAQTAGCLPIACDAWGIDYLAFSGHKGLLGPQGTGGLVVADGSPLPPLIQGGTGSRSQEERQPVFLPDRFESGTPNTPGLAGLGAAVEYLLTRDLAELREHTVGLIRRLMAGLDAIPGLCRHGSDDPAQNIGIVSFTLDGWDVAELADHLWQEHRIMVRAGLHCAPAAHRAIGTFPHGTVRASLGCQTTADEVDRLVQALADGARQTG